MNYREVHFGIICVLYLVSVDYFTDAIQHRECTEQFVKE